MSCQQHPERFLCAGRSGARSGGWKTALGSRGDGVENSLNFEAVYSTQDAQG